jgi:hypothetical protein
VSGSALGTPFRGILYGTAVMRPSKLLLAQYIFLFSCAAQAVGPSDNAFSLGETRRQASRETTEAQQHALFGRTVVPSLEIRRTEGTLQTAQYQQGDKILLQHFDNGHLIVWDFARGSQIGNLLLPNDATPVHFRRESGELLYLHNQKLWLRQRGEKSQPAEWLSGKSILTIATSADGKTLVAATPSGEILKLKPNGSVISSFSWRISGEFLAELSISAEGNLLVVARSGRTFQIDGGAPKELAAAVPGRKTHILQQGQGSLILENGTLTLQRGTESFKIDQEVRYVSALSAKRYLYIKSNGQAFLRSIDSEHYLLTLVSTPLGWVVVDQEGRYDGTVSGIKDVYWKAGDEQMSLDQFFNHYYKTGLLADYISDRESTLNKLPAKAHEGIYLPPKVDIDFPDGKLKPGLENKIIVVADSRGGDLSDEIRVFYNGKRLAPKTRIGSQKAQREDQILLAEVFAFTPESGPNEIFAEASNTHGIVGRSPVKKEVSEGHSSLGRLQMIAVGVDQYKQRELDLDFSKADAITLSKAIGQGASPIYSSVSLQTLVDKQASRAGIMQALSALDTASPQDSVVIILAGHGVLEGDEWYFLPHDANTKQISQTAISAKILQEALVNSPAKRIFLMVDACYSGGGIDTFNRYRDFQRHFAQQLGRSTGITVLTAARRDQFAAEATQLGHGLFSYVVLEGLKGAADTSPKDGTITAHELAAYVGEQMPRQLEQMSDVRGPGAVGRETHLQTPSYFVIGADFLLAGMRN